MSQCQGVKKFADHLFAIWAIKFSSAETINLITKEYARSIPLTLSGISISISCSIEIGIMLNTIYFKQNFFLPYSKIEITTLAFKCFYSISLF